MKIASANQMRMIDKYTMEAVGIPGTVLMERAGLSVSEEILKMENIDREIYIFCGTGNNGGDGFVIARHLSPYKKIKIYLIGEKENIKGDAKINYDIDLKLGLSINKIEDASKLNFDNCEMVVDCIFGTGLCRKVEGIYSEVIEKINFSMCKIISIDVPSGVCSDTGKILGTAVKADVTFSFALPKLGMFFYPGREFCGDIIVKDIGIPKKSIDAQGIKTYHLDSEKIKTIIKKRDSNTHKGSYGSTLIVGGSRGYTGAVILASSAALYTGSGIVTLALPESLHNIAENKVTEIITYPLKDKEYHISIDAIDQIKQLINRCNCTAIGMGMGQYEDGLKIIEELLKHNTNPLIIDADGLNIISENLELLANRKCEVIVTPHPGEMSRLMKVSVAEVEANRLYYATKLSKDYNICVVLKGSCSIIAYGEEAYINTIGNPGLAQGGSGDVLSGIIASLVSQGKKSLEACLSGVYIHGLAADLLAAKICNNGITAMEVAKNIPYAFKKILEKA